MIGSKENLSLVIINCKNGKFIEATLIRNDTKENYNDTLVELKKQLKSSNESLNEYDIVFEPMSNISENEMNDTDKYCMTYYRKNGEQGLIVDATKKQIINRIRTLKISLQTDAYECASLYNMRNALNIHQVLEEYSDTLGTF